MTGRERVKAAIKCEKTDRTPWVPFVGSHAGALLGIGADEYLKSADMIVKGAGEAVKRYKPDGLPVTFDLQIEAEVLGCGLKWAEDNPPAVVDHPLGNGTKLEQLKVPGAGEGRIGVVMEAARRIREEHPDVAVYGLITGPFTLALHLLGTDIFMKMFDDREYVMELLGFCRDVCKAMSRYYVEAGCDVIAVVDPMTSQIGPDQFTEYVSPFAKEVFDNVRELGALSSFFVCGHAQQNIEVMCECGPDNVSIDENIPLDYVRDECVKRGISFGGNMQLTTVLLLGSPLDAQKNAVECMELGGDKGFILAPGCDLPYATPAENLEAVVEVVEDEYKRDVVKTMDEEAAAGEKLDMSQYGQSDKVIVDIITLDSEACAPCQYMVDAVRKVAPEFDGLVEWREHKIKQKDSLVLMTSLMVRNVPTICIDGKITFVSRIPPKNELIEAIQKRINEKMRRRLSQRRATLSVVGSDDEKAQQAMENAKRAVKELGADVDVERLKDKDSVRDYGVGSDGDVAVVLTRRQVKAAGEVPETIVIKEWLKEL
ncbi:Uroporphyrinogen decarboxylase [Anaerohalosphaera lusitana]|uniref:Uroporphyrinogen decarboxylase n=1 Tax=Anaerohalosphaera lusitana TaxID=1936003 RepID=A0A1U9NQB5_9BACT|nr:uroporphyrinogen decarboxylase family protein [Anaerohalosphaera lusitana]AQT70005.1 Uroporphyrinogen decarboxylase [Anaerohalosphaera lusitana]